MYVFINYMVMLKRSEEHIISTVTTNVCIIINNIKNVKPDFT